MFLIIVNFKKSLEIVDQYLAAHREFLEQGYQKNYFIVSGRQNPRIGGIILSGIKNKEFLMQLLRQDPFYIHEIADYNVIEFEPVKYHPSFKDCLNISISE